MKKQLLLMSAFVLSLPFFNGLSNAAHAQGTFAWAKQLGSDNYDYSYNSVIKVDASGNVYTMGLQY